MDQQHVCFVILNYCSAELTEQCIQSIQNNIEYDNYSIVVVDNASPDQSGLLLQTKYSGDNQIHVLISDSNIGFAKGNNIGYKYAKEKLSSEYIIITNSDTIFEQKYFIQILQELFETKKYEVAGPDLITPQGVHQNPHRPKMLMINQVRKMLFIKSVFLLYFKIKRILPMGNKINILEKMFELKDKQTQKCIQYKLEQEQVVLQGACLIFSPSYISKEKNAFYPETFMYGEEDILTYFAYRKNYKLLYSPKLKVFHLEGGSTKKSYNDELKKNIFTYTYIVKGCKILLRLMKTNEFTEK